MLSIWVAATKNVTNLHQVKQFILPLTLVWWIWKWVWMNGEETKQVGNWTTCAFKKKNRRLGGSVQKNHTQRQQPGVFLLVHCYGMASHSPISICRKSANVAAWVTLASRGWSHRCSVALRSRLRALNSILSTPQFWSCLWLEVGPRLWRYGIGPGHHDMWMAKRSKALRSGCILPWRCGFESHFWHQIC